MVGLKVEAGEENKEEENDIEVSGKDVDGTNDEEE